MLSYSRGSKTTQLFSIPTQTIDLNQFIAYKTKSGKQTIKAFEISKQVTYKEYKQYLSAVKKDSSAKFYATQLPDSSIGTAEVFKKYISSSDYDNYPVMGISWDNAMNYCKWKTIKENKDSIKVIYRLPNCSEWLAAYSYLSENKIKNDLNGNYSDWLINSHDESILEFSPSQLDEKQPLFAYDWLYFHSKKDPIAMKRKLVIGNSYLYQQEKILLYSFSFYAFEGYKQIGFRFIKEKVSQSPINNKQKNSIAQSLIEHWNLSNK